MVDINIVTFAVIFGGADRARSSGTSITWYCGLPTSSSHALIGGYAGAAIAKAGFARDHRRRLDQDAHLHRAGAADRHGAGLRADDRLILWLFRRFTPARVDRWFRRLQLLSAAAYSLGHGGNDAQKTMGIIAGRAVRRRLHPGRSAIPIWVILLGARRDRARHAVRRLAHHPHDGIEDHQAAAGRRIRRRDRGRRSRCSPRPISASRSAPRTPSPARSSASARSAACPRCAGAWPAASSGPGSSRSRRRAPRRRSRTGWSRERWLRENAAIPQRRNSATPQRRNAATPQRRNAATPQLHNSTTPK